MSIHDEEDDIVLEEEEETVEDSGVVEPEAAVEEEEEEEVPEAEGKEEKKQEPATEYEKRYRAAYESSMSLSFHRVMPEKKHWIWLTDAWGAGGAGKSPQRAAALARWNERMENLKLDLLTTSVYTRGDTKCSKITMAFETTQWLTPEPIANKKGAGAATSGPRCVFSGHRRFLFSMKMVRKEGKNRPPIALTGRMIPPGKDAAASEEIIVNHHHVEPLKSLSFIMFIGAQVRLKMEMNTMKEGLFPQHELKAEWDAWVLQLRPKVFAASELVCTFYLVNVIGGEK